MQNNDLEGVHLVSALWGKGVAEFRRQIWRVDSRQLGDENYHRKWGRKPRLVAENCDNSSCRGNNAPDDGVAGGTTGSSSMMTSQHTFRLRDVNASMLHIPRGGLDGANLLLILHAPGTSNSWISSSEAT
ncbi:hypothetical protein TNCV_3508011 [Trichonephila clavipes]|uniref:Uncharacterized protein n=1 Tax=Trichonephila clavipes TaxID=2585209 RepID=A0A8X6RY97_TRICX|nr:hypothetical protein TNCV_3508011 [Trichonephila clavipes]